ncbi:uncharacterized protein F4812DRAFT_463581 [Daldinia caldariorum]|uniref:uncharacterized protein n=1 Tax=Daldinia caldariorum TaxID=326644 RepID=UPI0020082757|nr:uncharacterized protein F4812DRAFT_463581 [Daldinia caldariorum]KAI1463481.1 hypothetical protein F4812DRAFT_463581 [Daldinia caldariorum]
MKFTAFREGSSFLFFFSFLSSILLLSWQASTALALPTDTSSLVDVRALTIPNEEQVDELIQDPSKFSSWAKLGEPKVDTAIFFTGQSNKNINNIVIWANGVGLTSVRNIWNSDNFVHKGQYPKVSDAKFKDFQRAFSTYYADQTKGTAYLVFPHSQTPKADGIFWSIELERIIDNAKVGKIIWIDQSRIGDSNYDWKTEQKVYWQQGQEKPAGA